MKGSVLSCAAAVTVAAGGVLLGVAAPAAAAHDDDTATVCRKINDYNTPLRNALNTQTDQINSLTQSGDINGATAVAKQLAGTTQTWSTQVQQAAATASDPNLKSTLTTAATDAQQLSQQLSQYNGTQKISLDQFGSDNLRINSICGFTTQPAPSPKPSPS